MTDDAYITCGRRGSSHFSAKTPFGLFRSLGSVLSIALLSLLRRSSLPSGQVVVAHVPLSLPRYPSWRRPYRERRKSIASTCSRSPSSSPASFLATVKHCLPRRQCTASRLVSGSSRPSTLMSLVLWRFPSSSSDDGYATCSPKRRSRPPYNRGQYRRNAEPKWCGPPSSPKDGSTSNVFEHSPWCNRTYMLLCTRSIGW